MFNSFTQFSRWEKRHYILPILASNSINWSVFVENASTVNKSVSNDIMIVTLYKGDETNHPMLDAFTEYSHDEILQYLIDNDAEWNEPII